MTAGPRKEKTLVFTGNCRCISGLLIAAMLLLPGKAYGMLPPEQIQAKNLAASDVLIGRVEEVRPAPAGWRNLLPLMPDGDPWSFTLNLTHVVKSSAPLKAGERVTVLFIQEKAAAGGIAALRTGWLAVRVAPGDLVVVYANPQDHEGQRLLLPLLAGLSVVRLTPPNAPAPKH